MFLLMSALAVGMVSCGGGDDDDGGGKSNRRAKIAGKWIIQCIKVTKLSPKGSSKDEDLELKRTYSFQKWDNGTQLTLYDDGTYTDSSNSGRHKWDVTSDGDLEMDDHEFEYYEEDPKNSIVETEDEYYHYYWCWYKSESFEIEDDPGSGGGEEHCLVCELPVNPDPVMPIYKDVTPPNIEGCYLMKKVVAVYCSDGYFKKGEDLNEADYIRFSNQNMKKNTIDYQNNSFDSTTDKLYSTETGPGAYIQGSDNSFTVWFNTWGKIEGTNVKVQTFTILSGTRTKDGIRNLYYMTMFTDKQNDYNNEYMPIGTYRIFKDGDGYSPETEWRTRAMAERAMEATNIYPWHRYAAKKGGVKK